MNRKSQNQPHPNRITRQTARPHPNSGTHASPHTTPLRTRPWNPIKRGGGDGDGDGAQTWDQRGREPDGIGETNWVRRSVTSLLPSSAFTSNLNIGHLLGSAEVSGFGVCEHRVIRYRWAPLCSCSVLNLVQRVRHTNSKTLATAFEVRDLR